MGNVLKTIARAVLPRGARNWLRAPGRSLAWGWGHVAFLAGLRRRVELRPGWQVVCHPLAYRHSYFAQVEDAEQVAEFDSFLSYCTPNMVLFDLGAHFGLFSLAALHYGGSASRAVAVDASPVAARMLAAQASLNGVTGRLAVVRACVCERVGERGLVAGGVLCDGYYTAPGPAHTAGEITATPATTLDALADRFGVRPTHVKIDVEGFEAEVLRGGRRLLSSDPPPLLFLEMHTDLIRRRGADPAAVVEELAGLGYATFDLAGAPAGSEALLARPLTRLIARRDRVGATLSGGSQTRAAVHARVCDPPLNESRGG
jgi:FkbM family methyltransferase